MEIPQKIKTRTTILPSSSTPGYISKGNTIKISRMYLHPHIHCSIIHSSQDMDTTQVCIYRWMVCMWNGILLTHKEERNPAICNNMDGPWGYYTKWNKSDRRKQIPYNITYLLNRKKSNLQTQYNEDCQELGVLGRRSGYVCSKGTNCQLQDGEVLGSNVQQGDYS